MKHTNRLTPKGNRLRPVRPTPVKNGINPLWLLAALTAVCAIVGMLQDSHTL